MKQPLLPHIEDVTTEANAALLQHRRLFRDLYAKYRPDLLVVIDTEKAQDVDPVVNGLAGSCKAGTIPNTATSDVESV